MLKSKTILTNAYEFKKRFNSFSEKIESPFRINEITFDYGEEQNTSTIMLTDLIAINLIMNIDDNSIREIVVVAQGDGSKKSGYDILLTIGTVISITNQHLDESGRAKVLSELGLTKGLPKKATHKTVGNIRYTLSHSKDIAIVFTANNKKDLYTKTST